MTTELKVKGIIAALQYAIELYDKIQTRKIAGGEMSDVFTTLEEIKKNVPLANGNREQVDRVSQFVKDTLNVYRILKSEHNNLPIMEDVNEEIRRYEERWG